ncbi:hypothetical protein [Bradyrhizobium ottawaense]|uniref:Uncharacterized protein n=1 Tax=Bradyrhizobium ottawaense TaxID=931866 RepID=A0ABV4G0W1_9BRAD
MSFISKWAGLLGLLAVLVVGDQIRINRPGHKFRLTVEVTTPDGIKAGSGVLAVVPDRNYNRGGRTTMRGEAVFVDLGQSKNLVALLARTGRTPSWTSTTSTMSRSVPMAPRAATASRSTISTG